MFMLDALVSTLNITNLLNEEVVYVIFVVLLIQPTVSTDPPFEQDGESENKQNLKLGRKTLQISTIGGSILAHVSSGIPPYSSQQK